jgi:predicted DCC family thiol-disulfide oxidoreductase YuxK
MQHGIVLFDGVCNFCNSKVDLIIRKDKKDFFRFASLQSDFARNLIKAKGKDPDVMDSMIYISPNGKMYIKSSAALRIAGKLKFPYPLLFPLLIIPPFLRNLVYDFIAKNRYKWWGKKSTCRIPSPEEGEKFIA